MELAVFVLASAAAIVAAGTVVLHKNPLICALALVANLLAVAVLFLTLSAQFIAVLQLIIYAGAIMVLIVFVIMLLHVQRDPARVGAVQTALACLGAAGLLAAIVRGIAAVSGKPPAEVGEDYGTAAWLARTLFSDYYYPFEVISLVLLAAMAGAVLFAKRET